MAAENVLRQWEEQVRTLRNCKRCQIRACIVDDATVQCIRD